MRQFFLRDYIKNAVRIFFLGIIVGIVMMFLFRNQLQEEIYLFNEEWILYIQEGSVNVKSLFVYTLFQRLKAVGFMLLLSTTAVGIICLYGYTAVLGVGAGVFLSVACLKYGLKGLLLILVASFPQILVYLPAFLYLFHLCYIICIKLYFPHKDYWRSGSTDKVFWVRNIVQICLMLLVVIIGILLESYVNPKIFFPFIKNF